MARRAANWKDYLRLSLVSCPIIRPPRSANFEDMPELKLPKVMLDLAAHIVQTKLVTLTHRSSRIATKTL
jgi:non-homologous end joining protein Ku